MKQRYSSNFSSGSRCPCISHAKSLSWLSATRYLFGGCYFLHVVNNKFAQCQKIFSMAHIFHKSAGTAHETKCCSRLEHSIHSLCKKLVGRLLQRLMFQEDLEWSKNLIHQYLTSAPKPRCVGLLHISVTYVLFEDKLLCQTSVLNCA